MGVQAARSHTFPFLNSLITSTSCKLRSAHPRAMTSHQAGRESPFKEILEGIQPVSDDPSCAHTSSSLKREEGIA